MREPTCWLQIDDDLEAAIDMRLTSNGIGSAIIVARRGSFITFALTRSRCARDL
jgi:hypothetical protein